MKNKEKAPFSRGAYYAVRNPQNYPTETFSAGTPHRVPLTQLCAE